MLSPSSWFLICAAAADNPSSIVVPKRSRSSYRGILCSSMLWILSAFSFIFLSCSSFSSLGNSKNLSGFTFVYMDWARNIRIEPFGDPGSAPRLFHDNFVLSPHLHALKSSGYERGSPFLLDFVFSKGASRYFLQLIFYLHVVFVTH